MQEPTRFEFDVQGREPQQWSWRSITAEGVIFQLSRTTFQTLHACVKDAKKHGYTPPVGLRD
jgi:hypothetical protein